jgi:hypothetical protein
MGKELPLLALITQKSAVPRDECPSSKVTCPDSLEPVGVMTW